MIAQISKDDRWQPLVSALYEQLRGQLSSEAKSYNLRFGSLSVSLSVQGPELAAALLPTLGHAESSSDEGLPIWAFDLGSGEPGAFKALTGTLDRQAEYVHIRRAGAVVATWQPASRCLEMLDRHTEIGLLCSSKCAAVPNWEWAAPLRRLIHWTTTPTSSFVLHGAGLLCDRIGVLLTGLSGSGKSTITAHALANEFSSAGDDMILIEETNESSKAVALYDALKVDSSRIDSLGFAKSVSWSNIASDGGKKLCAISAVGEGKLAPMFDLHAIIVPAVKNLDQTTITPVTADVAIRAMAPTTMQILRGGEQQTLSKIIKLARSLPCFRMDLSSDPDETVEVLRKFCGALA